MPFCGQTAEVASISHFVFAHQCREQGWLYTNGLLWSRDMKEVVPVERIRPQTSHGDVGA